MSIWRAQFVVQGEPVAKGRPRACRRGASVATYTPDETRKAEEDFILQAKRHRPPTPLLGGVRLKVISYRGIPESWTENRKRLARCGFIGPTSKPDWDNLGKLVSDAMNGIFYKDDAQVIECTVVKMYASSDPRTEVTIEGIQEAGS